jgi:tetratricopeptide (TPR) repeat protein
MARHRGTSGDAFYDEMGSSPEDWATPTPRYDPLADLRQQAVSPTDLPWPVAQPRPSLTQRMAKTWPLWTMGALVTVMGLGLVSVIALLRIPNLPNCRAIFWPMASASTRLQCAEAFADQGTVEGYLEAIALIEALPPDHPLSSEISQRIQVWADQILDLAEQAFQDGQIQAAIDMARRIPHTTAAARVVDERVDTWKQIWQEAEAIYATAEAELVNLKFQEALNQATRLLQVRNTHWKTVKYNEMIANIATAHDDLNTLGEAKRLANQRTLDALKEAIEMVRGIVNESPIHGEAQKVLGELGEILIEMAESALNRRDATAALQMLAEIPSEANLGADVADMRAIVDATQLSWQGSISGLEGAITQLQSIDSRRPRYDLAQRLVGQWRNEVGGRAQLEWAKQVAMAGTIEDLQAAMAEAEKISRSNPVWNETQNQIEQWRTQVETTEDRPILDEARQFARLGDLPSAMATARQVSPGRTLHSEAQELIRGWRSDLERQEDGPILAAAPRWAAVGQLQEAITTASRIARGRALYDQAQDNLTTWRSQLQGQQQLQQAYQLAQQGSVSALVRAIQAAQQVPENTPQRPEALSALNRWSLDLLRVAESESRVNLTRAIEIATAIPPQTEAYAQAQRRLREWQVPSSPPPPLSNP